jgi:hypothetical protein
MTTWNTSEDYYSGQGVVLIGRRDANGNPKGLRSIGNVSDLKIAVSTSVLEHKESNTGQRAIDLRLTTETKANLNFTLENFSATNLAEALRGDATLVAGGTSTDFPVYGYQGMVTSLGQIKVSAVSIKQLAVAMTAYTNEQTAWDYKLNADAGSIMINDGKVQAVDKLGPVVTAIAVGATTLLTVGNKAVVGDSITPRGFTGADAAFINDLPFTITARSDTTITINLNSTAKVITAAAGSRVVFPGMSLLATFTYAEQYKMDALTKGVEELFMRFEGLNTAKDNSPVVVEVFRFQSDPLKELALISDGVQAFVRDGNMLADAARPAGSKFFVVQKLS